jgi:hypothetical protein
MLRRAYFITGLFLILIGTFLFVNSFQSITGLAIVEGVDSLDSGFAGGFFIFAGLFSLFLSKKRRKGQAAVEFLMTYGWAVLAAVIAIGVLAYFGVFNSDKLVGDSVFLSPPFYMRAWLVTPYEIVFEIQNSGPERYNVKEIKVNYYGGKCYFRPYSYISVASERSVQFNIPCLLGSEKKIKGDIIVRYVKDSSNLIQTASGTINSKVLPGHPISYYSLTIEIIGNGIVTCNGDDCDGALYTSDSEISLVAHATPGNTFEGWGGECEGQAEECIFTINSEMSIIATFTGGGIPI